MIFINKPAYYWLKPTYSVLVGGTKHDNKARLIEAVLARIGRDKPMYSDRYAKIAVRLCNRYSEGLGVQTLMKALAVTEDGRYKGHGVGRFIFKNGSGRFDADKYEMEPEEGAVVCIIDDWQVRRMRETQGQGQRPRKKGIHHRLCAMANWRQSHCDDLLQKCRAEMRKMTKAFCRSKTASGYSTNYRERQNNVTHENYRRPSSIPG